MLFKKKKDNTTTTMRKKKKNEAYLRNKSGNDGAAAEQQQPQRQQQQQRQQHSRRCRYQLEPSAQPSFLTNTCYVNKCMYVEAFAVAVRVCKLCFLQVCVRLCLYRYALYIQLCT